MKHPSKTRPIANLPLKSGPIFPSTLDLYPPDDTQCGNFIVFCLSDFT